MTALSRQTATTSVSALLARKRLVDIGFSLPLLIASAPLCLFIAAVVRAESRGPAIFKQVRVGRDGQPFTIYKFRSMRVDAPNISTAEMQQLGYSPITRFGAFLRRTSLDELPQMVNILRGDMSFVGPRPSLPSQSYLNGLRAASGVDVLRPGLTGWAQVNGRDELSDDEKARLDTEYLRRASLRFDAEILFRTLASVISGRGNR